MRTYDTWKCTNPDDEFLGPEPEPDENMPPEPEPCPRCAGYQGRWMLRACAQVWQTCKTCGGTGLIERGTDG